MPIYDYAILGAGVAGCFALKRILSQEKNAKVILIDAGRIFTKRRHQIFGALGLMPNSSGKLCINDLAKVSSIAGSRRTTYANKYVVDQLLQVSSMKLLKDRRVSLSLEKKLIDNGFDLFLNNYYQLFPKEIHAFSRLIVADIDKDPNAFLSFDNEIYQIIKNKNSFTIITCDGEFEAKQILFSVGRGGWRFSSKIFENFGLIENNDTAKFGIKVELSQTCLKDFNKSNCTLNHNLVSIGPFSHSGTVVPEDHIDFANASYRDNENRWKSDKTSFNIMAEKNFNKSGWENLDRIAQLTFLVSNERLMKEKISTLINGKSKLSDIKEYDWLIKELNDIANIIPSIIEKGYFYAPCLEPMCPKINISQEFETDVSGMFVAGESAGIPGLLGACVSGTIAADAMLK